jgi:hypothetical protein
MSKSLTFMIKNNNVVHDSNKICFNWNCDQERKKKDNEMYLKLIDTNLPYVVPTQREVEDLIDRNIKYLCPLCYWYSDRFDIANEVSLDDIYFDHSYLNPILDSDWCIYNFIGIGKNLQTYNSNINISRLIFEDIVSITKTVYNLGMPSHKADIKAFEQTKQFIKWAKKWLKNPDKPNYNTEIICYLQFN